MRERRRRHGDGRVWVTAATALMLGLGAALAARSADAPRHNVIIFVADGLRSEIVDETTAPAMAAIRREGVDFRNSHSLYPTLTTPNASAIATGHGVGDTGDFANTIYAGAPALTPAFLSLTPFIEEDATLGALNDRFGGNYLGQTTFLAAARAAGYATASLGKDGPVAIQDVTARDGLASIVIDDQTGQPEGVPLDPTISALMVKAGLDPAAPDRGLNQDPGNSQMSGVHVANVDQQDWFARIATDVLLPRFKAQGRPFAMVFWSRDPDGTQHNQGDSLNTPKPGINGPTTMAAIKNADNDLAKLRATLKALGLDRTTDIVIASDHGFSTIAKTGVSSGAARRSYIDVPKGFLPPGFLAIDLAQALNLPLMESNGLPVDLAGGFHPKRASAILGADAKAPDVVIGANGGSDMIWLPTPKGRALAKRITAFLAAQNYTSAIFTADGFGPLPGALPLSAVGLQGSARTPAPDIVVSFKSWTSGCAKPETCAVEVSDTDLQQGQGMHGAFSRADTHNLMAAVGPDFRRGFVDPLPVSNADWAPTLARALGISWTATSPLAGRVMAEGLAEGGAEAPVAAAVRRTERSTPAANGFVTTIDLQEMGGKRYYDAAGARGRTLGLQP